MSPAGAAAVRWRGKARMAKNMEVKMKRMVGGWVPVVVLLLFVRIAPVFFFYVYIYT